MTSQFIKECKEKWPHYHFYYLFPDAKSGYKYDEDGFFRLSNVTRIPYRLSTRKMANAITYDGAFFDRLFRTVGIDIIWSHLPEISPHLRVADQPTYDIKARPFVMSQHNYPAHPSLPVPFHTMENIAMAQAAGAILSDCNITITEYGKKLMMDLLKQWFNNEAIQEANKKTFVLYYGALDTSIELRVNNNDMPIISYNHRLQGYKDYKTTFNILNELYSDGFKFQVWYLSNTKERVSDIAHYPFVKVYLNRTHKEYLSRLSRCDLNITNTKYETFCLSAAEAMAFGQCLIAPNSLTFPEITGQSKTKYPYLFDNVQSQKDMIRKLLTESSERQRWGRILSEYVLDRFNRAKWVEQYTRIWGKYENIELGTPDDVKGAILDMARRHNNKNLKDIYGAITGRMKVSGRRPLGTQSFPMIKLVRLLRSMGIDIYVRQGKQFVDA